jgi:hypothetical protein
MRWSWRYTLGHESLTEASEQVLQNLDESSTSERGMNLSAAQCSDAFLQSQRLFVNSMLLASR